MTARDRFLHIMNYEGADRVPVLALEPFETISLERWQREGLPPNRTITDFLGMDELVYVPVSFEPMPAFDRGLIREDEQYVIERNVMGATVKRRKDAPATFYGHIDHPVKTPADWEEYKERFRAETRQRSPDDWGHQRIPQLNECQNPVGFCFYPYFFRLGFYALGMERFLTAFHEEPDLIRDMFSYWNNFVIDTISPLLGVVQLDFALFAEDLAGKNGPLISPKTYSEFWLPHQDKLIQILRDHGVPVICHWSAGQFDSLLPIMLDHGFNCTWPLEVTAGMDAGELRARHGRRLRLGGNIAKEALIAGPEAIDREIDRLMPLINDGGFVPALDDMVPMEVPFSHYRYLVEKLRNIRLA